MGSVNTITIAGSNFSIYGTLAGADTYFSASFSRATGWAAFSTTEKKRLLVGAFRLLERQTWEGTKTGGVSQTTAFPRDGLTDRDGTALADNAVPDELEYGEYELAYYLGQENVDPNADPSKEIKSESFSVAGVISEKTDYFQPSVRDIEDRFPPEVQEWAEPFLAGDLPSALSSATGTGESSIYDDDMGVYERNLPS